MRVKLSVTTVTGSNEIDSYTILSSNSAYPFEDNTMAAKKKTGKTSPKKKTSQKKTPRNKMYGQIAARNRARNAEIFSEKAKGNERIRQILDDIAEFKKLSDAIAKAKNSKASPYHVSTTITKNEARARILNHRVTANFKLLAKLWPDLKSVELSDPEGNNPIEALGHALKHLLGNREEEE